MGEPGYGKTRLLEEILKECDKKDIECFLLSLKSLDMEIDKFMGQDVDVLSGNNEVDNAIEYKKAIKTDEFNLNSKKQIVVCLDALDEVDSYKFRDTVKKINTFARKYPQVNIIVSCRTAFIEQIENKFRENDFIFASLEPFTEENIRMFLVDSGEQEETIEKLIERLSSCLIVPRYLTMMKELLDKEVDVSNVKKGDILEKFIYRELEIEREKKGETSQDIEITKRILEKIALIMQIYQTKQITKDELITFFDEIDSGLKDYFLKEITLDKFYSRLLLRNNGDTIQFQNAEFQEYLAAKEIMRLGNVEQVVFDLSVNKNLREIFPNWYNTVKFLIEMHPPLLRKVIEYGKNNSSEIKTDSYFRFIIDVETESITEEDKREIFKTIFYYYQKQAYWIDYGIVMALPRFYDSSLEKILKKSVEKQDSSFEYYRVRVGNTIIVVNALVESNLHELDKEYWETELLQLIKTEDNFIKRQSVSLLGNFNDLNLLEQIYDDIKNSDHLVWDNYTAACVKVNPNDTFSVKIIIDNIKRGDWRSKSYIAHITGKEGVEYILNKFIYDRNFLMQFANIGRTEEKTVNTMIENIEAVWDEEIEQLVEDVLKMVLVNDDMWPEDLQIIMELARLINQKTEKYILNLLEKIDYKKRNVYKIKSLCANIIEPNQIDEFVIEAKKMDLSDFALAVLQNSSFHQNVYSKAVYEAGRKHFEEEYKEKEKQRAGTIKSEEKRLQEKYKLEPREDRYMTDVFEYVVRNSEELIPLIKRNEEDYKRLKCLINHVFEQADPSNAMIKIKREDNNLQSYKIDEIMIIFGTCIRLARLLGMDISKYRRKIILFIPWAFDEVLDDIFYLISEFKDEEIDELLSIYESPQKRDLIEFWPSSFIKTCNEYNLHQSKPILKGFINNTNLHMTDRVHALQALTKYEGNENYFYELFKTYEECQESEEILEAVNRILIDKYSNKDAILWRIDEIKGRAFELPSDIDSNVKVRTISDGEAELTSRHFAKPIMNISDIEYKDIFLEMLEYSFELLDESGDYRQYSNYIWDIVLEYFNNLKWTRDSNHLVELEMWIEERSDKFKDINWFKYRIQELKVVYLNETDKPTSMHQSIQTYNRIKERAYLNITHPRDLVSVIQKIIDEDLREWVEFEGAYRFIEQSTGKQETMIQKTIKTQFENALLKQGFRNVGIIREPQLLDDIRPDFLISYGFVGKVIIEIKRVSNEQVTNRSKREEYKTKLKRYMDGTDSDYVIYLLFNTKKEDKLKDYVKEVKESYKDEKWVFVEGLSCIPEI